jgi:hypothetical protein
LEEFLVVRQKNPSRRKDSLHFIFLRFDLQDLPAQVLRHAASDRLEREKSIGNMNYEDPRGLEKPPIDFRTFGGPQMDWNGIAAKGVDG